jgi:hypothetical protein
MCRLLRGSVFGGTPTTEKIGSDWDPILTKA